MKSRIWSLARRRRCGCAGDRVLDQGDAAALARFLDEPRREFGTRVTIAERDENGRVVGARDAHVWHCSLSLHPDEPALSDQRWGELCDEFVAAMGFAGPDARAQCRWVAIRHGESAGGSDHAHVVVALVAEDGSKASVHYDQPRAQNAARELEQRFGLLRLEARTRGTGSRGVRAGERMADARRQRDHGAEGRAPERGSRQTLERIVRGVRDREPQRDRVRPRVARTRRACPSALRGGRAHRGRGLLGSAARTRQRAAALGLVWRRAPGARSDIAVTAGGVAAVGCRAGGCCEAVEHVDELAAAYAR